MTTMYGPPCSRCLHRTSETFKHSPWVCEVFPEGLPRNILYEGVECPHFDEDKTIPKKAADKPKPEPKKADGGLVTGKKLIRFQLPANPTTKDVDKLSKWVKEQ